MALEIEGDVLKKYIPEEGETAVTVPQGVRHIADSAFAYQEQLQQVCLPDGLQSIERFAFGDSEIAQIDLPDSLCEIGEFAFKGCGWLRRVQIPPRIRTLSKGAFSSCGRLSDVILPEGLEVIETYAFHECGMLSSIRFPHTLREIEKQAFEYTGPLKADLPEGLRSIGKEAFRYSDMRRICLPDSLRSLGPDSLYMCQELDDIRLPLHLPEETREELWPELCRIPGALLPEMQMLARAQLLIARPEETGLYDAVKEKAAETLELLAERGHADIIHDLFQIGGLFLPQALDPAVTKAAQHGYYEIQAMLLREKKLRGGYDGTGGLLSL